MTEQTSRPWTLGEEIAHSITHGIGAALSVAALVVLTMIAYTHGDTWQLVGCSVFGTTLVLLYTASTLYHSIPHPPTKAVFQALDYSAIYLLIAGSYTPFTLVNLRGPWGWSLFGVVWGLALLGIILRFSFLKRSEIASLTLYIAMGWTALVAAKPILETFEVGGIILIVLGGVAYTAGVAFYAWERLPYHHAIWHVFVLAGSTFHFFAVLNYVLPVAGIAA